MLRLKGELLIMINYSKDYFNDILIRMAYHSSGIEGNTISLPETVTIILENKMPTSGKTIREFYEIENHYLMRKKEYYSFLNKKENEMEL